MQIKFDNFFKISLFFFHILKILIPKQGRNITTIVYLKSKINSSYLFLERNFFFKQKEIKFFSYMIPQENNKAIEIMALLHPKLYFTLFAIFGINFCYF